MPTPPPSSIYPIDIPQFAFLSCTLHERGCRPSTIKMFENFSFSSASSNGGLSPAFDVHDSLPPCVRTDNHIMISPLSSRCPSPLPRTAPYPPAREHRSSSQPSATSVHRLSINSLTHKLKAHSLEPQSPDLPPTPPYSQYDEDEGYAGPYSPEDLSPTSADFPSTYLDMLAPTPTSNPTGCLTLSRRYQRQFLSRLQCSASHALSLAMLAEECHPSSLPLPPMAESSSSGSTSRKTSVSSPSTGPSRIQKAPTRTQSSISLAGLSLEDSPKSTRGGTGSRKSSVVVQRGAKLRNRTGTASGAGRR